MVALTISGMVVLLAHDLVRSSTDSTRALTLAKRSADREHNGYRWLRAAFLSLDVGEGLGGFEGQRDRVEFTAWLEQPGGWFSAERIALSVHDSQLQAVTAHAGVLVLADSTEALAVDYLLEPGENTRWVQQWLSPLSAPLAVRLRVLHGTEGEVDTLLFLIKERG